MVVFGDEGVEIGLEFDGNNIFRITQAVFKSFCCGMSRVKNSRQRWWRIGHEKVSYGH